MCQLKKNPIIFYEIIKVRNENIKQFWQLLLNNKTRNGTVRMSYFQNPQ